MKKNKLEDWGYKIEPLKLSLNVDLIRDGEDFCITTNNESEAILGQTAFSQGKTLEEAEKSFWEMVRSINEFHSKRSGELDKWKLFQKGDWKHIGGTWFSLLGIHVYFRHGDDMKFGWYVPFTKLNISIHNYWRKLKTK